MFLCLSSVCCVCWFGVPGLVGVFGIRLYTFDVIFMVLVCLNVCFVWVVFGGCFGYNWLVMKSEIL